MSESGTVIEEWRDLWYVVRLRPNTHWMDVEVFDHCGYDTASNQWSVTKVDAVCSADGTSNLDEAKPILTGSIKWDGCSNFQFPDDCYHWCGRKDAADFGKMIDRLYERAASMIKAWDDND